MANTSSSPPKWGGEAGQPNDLIAVVNSVNQNGLGQSGKSDGVLATAGGTLLAARFAALPDQPRADGDPGICKVPTGTAALTSAAQLSQHTPEDQQLCFSPTYKKKDGQDESMAAGHVIHAAGLGVACWERLRTTRNR